LRNPTKLVYFNPKAHENHSHVGIILITPHVSLASEQLEEFVSSAVRGAYRNTAQRAIILEEVENSDEHMTAGEIFERVRKRYPSIAYGTVYRTLHLLAEHDLIQELTFADQASRFDKRTDRHDHVHCTECGALADVNVPVATGCETEAGRQTGWHITRHHTLFEGVCPDCHTSQAGTAQA
jgi:Fe2+ or Zn2+ uptake regulation protein